MVTSSAIAASESSNESRHVRSRNVPQPEELGSLGKRFERRGYECIAPAWQLHDEDPAEIRQNPPTGLGELSLGAVLDQMRAAAAPYDDLILIGHSVGGLIVQKLITEGVGRLAVPICSVGPNKMLSLDWGLLRNSVAISNPLKGNEPYPMDADGFYENFGNTMARAASDAAFAAYALSDSRNVFRDCMGDNGHIDLDRPHAPLLFIAAEKDQIIPPELCAKNAKAYTDTGSTVDYCEFKGRGHFICGEPGWEDVATYIGSWIEAHGNRSGRSQSVGDCHARI